MPQSTCNGFLDGIALNGNKIIFSGWAKCTDISRPLVTAICDGKPTVSGIADKYREDLVNIISESGCNGFELTVPRGVVNGSSNIKLIIHSTEGSSLVDTSHTVKALSFKDKIIFKDYVCPLTKLIYKKRTDDIIVEINNGKVTINTLTLDDILNNSNVNTEEYSVIIDEKLIYINNYLVYQKVSDVITKSLIEIPIEIPELGKKLKILKYNKSIFECTIPYDARYNGYLEGAEWYENHITVSGWASDLYKLFEIKKIKIIISDGTNRVETSVSADLHRDDLELHLGYGASGFKAKLNIENINIPISIEAYIDEGDNLYRINTIDSFSIINKANNNAEFFSEVGESDEILGSVDYINNNILYGWARNNTNPNSPTLLDIYLDNKLFVSTWANRYRSDLEKYFNDHGCHAFQVDFATNINAFSDHEISVKPRVGLSKINYRVSKLKSKVIMKHISEETGM